MRLPDEDYHAVNLLLQDKRELETMTEADLRRYCGQRRGEHERQRL